MGDLPLVVLSCQRCHREQVHVIEHAGSMLLATRCACCGFETRPLRTSLRRDYTRQFETRVLSKPRRVLEAAMADPVGFVRHLPAAVLTKPYKLGEEWATIHHALHPDADHDTPPPE